MDCKTITERLRRVAAIVDSWKDENGVPQIERDIALGELRDIYNALLVVDVDDTISTACNLIPPCYSSSLAFHMMGFSYKLNKQDDNK